VIGKAWQFQYSAPAYQSFEPAPGSTTAVFPDKISFVMDDGPSFPVRLRGFSPFCGWRICPVNSASRRRRRLFFSFPFGCSAVRVATSGSAALRVSFLGNPVPIVSIPVGPL
jgi:hypothetical protein